MKNKKNTIRRSAMFLSIIDMLQGHDEASLKEIAFTASVSITTLHNWKYGKTISPRIDTLIKVSAVLGFTIGLKKTMKTNQPKR